METPLLVTAKQFIQGKSKEQIVANFLFLSYFIWVFIDYYIVIKRQNEVFLVSYFFTTKNLIVSTLFLLSI